MPVYIKYKPSSTYKEWGTVLILGPYLKYSTYHYIVFIDSGEMLFSTDMYLNHISYIQYRIHR